MNYFRYRNLFFLIPHSRIPRGPVFKILPAGVGKKFYELIPVQLIGLNGKSGRAVKVPV
jgi:hypothetical protein